MSPKIRVALVIALLAVGSMAGVSSAGAAGPVVVSYDGTVGTVTGTSADEEITVVVSNGEILVNAPSIQPGPGCETAETNTVSCSTGAWPNVRVTMGYGDDSVTLYTIAGGAQTSGRTYIDTGGNNDTVYLAVAFGFPVRADIALGSGNDHANIDLAVSKEVSVNGGPGADLLEGSPVADIIGGGSGNDTITGGNDNDALDGDSGNDTITGGSGQDLILGDYGTDNLDGGNGQDAIYGGYGNDTIFGGVGTDLPAGGDELNGNAGADIITGGNRPGSRLFGGEGIDSLNAQNGVAEAIINCGESTDKAKGDPGELLFSCEKPLP